VLLYGADLYRMNCRGCHGEVGAGAPPEINSVINPVRATSAQATRESMRSRGIEMSAGDAAKLAQQSRTMLLDRLHHGGHDMPAFPHLSEAEIKPLIAYLRLLADVPGAQNEQTAVQVERVRIGEHIAKSTCHVCHSAAGSNPTLQQLYQGVIPPLSSLPQRVTQEQFVRKVTHGAPILMGAPQQLLRGRMPVFYYLTEEEAADVYLYLTAYPPSQSDVLEAGASSGDPVATTETTQSGSGQNAASASAAPSAGAAPSVTSAAQHRALHTSSADGAEVTILLIPLALLATMVIGLGFWFSIYELRRLAGERKIAKLQPEVGIKSSSQQLGAGWVA
jgi:mono/diheme cytochrome c family protein